MLSNKRILILVRSMEISGGTQKLVAEISKQFEKKKYNVCINTLFYNKKDCYKKELKGVNIRSVVTANKTNRLIKYLLSSGRIATIFQFLSFWIITVVNIGKYGIIIPQDDFSAIILSLFPKKNDQKIIWYLNYQLSGVIINTYKDHRTLVSKIRHFVYQKAFAKIDHFAVWSEYNKKLIEKYIKRKADLVYAGADLSTHFPISNLRIQTEKKCMNILTIGILYPYRRYEDIINAIYILGKKSINCKLTIVGKSIYSPQYLLLLKNLVVKRGLNTNVKFIEYLSDNDKYTEYKKSDVFVFVNDGNTWGISVFEAVASGMPVVITNNIGAVDLINNDCGWIVRPRSPKEVALSIEQIYNEPNLVKLKTARAISHIRGLLTWEAFTNRLLKLVEND